ncbi:MAG: cation:proton antiporter [Rhodocyclaceae bacterium]
MTLGSLSLPLEIIVGGVLAISFAMRMVANALGQPHVIGEILAGLLIGLVLMAGAGDVARGLAGQLSVLGSFGLIFLVLGALLHEPDTLGAQRQWRTDLFFTACNVLPAFVCGGAWAIAYARAHTLAAPGAFVLLVATAAAISAVPVLARILAELRLADTRVGALSFRVACLTDVAGWLLVGVSLAIHTQGEPWAFALGRLALILMLFAVLAGIRRMLRPWLGTTPATTAVVIVLLLAACGLTHMAGLHVVFGAFIVGTVFGGEASVVRHWRRDMGWVTERFFCPLYFVVAGMSILSGGTLTAGDWGWGVVFLALSMGSKILPLYWAARRRGWAPDEARLLGLLLNARGLMELVILGIGLQAGIFTATQYALFVAVAVVTTVVCTPLCRVVLKRMHAASDAAVMPRGAE